MIKLKRRREKSTFSFFSYLIEGKKKMAIVITEKKKSVNIMNTREVNGFNSKSFQKFTNEGWLQKL